MTFSKRQFAAIYKMGQAMVLADGTINEKETAIVGGELIKFGVTPSDLEELIADSESMEFSKAVEIVATLNLEQKRYVSSFLATIMAVDGDIDDSEVQLWKLVSILCGFPQMTIRDGISYMAQRYK